MKLFEPQGEEAKWKSVYNLGVNTAIGTFFDWDELKEAIGFDIQNGHRGLIYEANKRLLKDANRLFKSVRTLGYKLAEPSEQLKQAETRPLKASRQMKKGIAEAFYIDTSNMSSAEIVRQMHLVVRLQSSLQIIRKKNIEALKTSEKAVGQQKNALNKIDAMMNDLQNMKKIFGKESSKLAA